MKAPSFKLQDQHDNTVELPKRGVVVVYFYPKADTPGCTLEAKKFTELYPEFIESGALIIGISPDDTKSNCKFKEKYGIPFPLLSDPDKQVAKAYGAWGKKKMYGREYEGIIRKSYLVVDGNIVSEYKHKPGKTEEQILNDIRELNKQS